MKRPLEDRPDLVKYVGDEPMLSLKAVALIHGVSEEEFRAEMARQGGRANFVIPNAWLQRGKEIKARLGTDNMAEALFLLAREREAELN